MLRLARLIVMGAVELNNKQPVDANEVEKVAVKGSLPTKMEALRMQVLEPCPEPDSGSVMAFRRLRTLTVG